MQAVIFASTGRMVMSGLMLIGDHKLTLERVYLFVCVRVRFGMGHTVICNHVCMNLHRYSMTRADVSLDGQPSK